MNPGKHFVLASFAAANVEFAVVGGAAVNAYGYLRATQDIDIFIRPSIENATTAFAALQECGVPLDAFAPEDLLSDEANLRFGEYGEQIDILSSIGEMSFEQVWRNREMHDVNGLAVPFISLADLIENKKQVGRLRDLADVEELRSIAKLDAD